MSFHVQLADDAARDLEEIRRAWASFTTLQLEVSQPCPNQVWF